MSANRGIQGNVCRSAVTCMRETRRHNEQIRYGSSERHRAELRQARREAVGGQTSYKGFLLYDLTVPLPSLICEEKCSGCRRSHAGPLGMRHISHTSDITRRRAEPYTLFSRSSWCWQTMAISFGNNEWILRHVISLLATIQQPLPDNGPELLSQQT
jgi:hypothetical protein